MVNLFGLIYLIFKLRLKVLVKLTKIESKIEVVFLIATTESVVATAKMSAHETTPWHELSN